MRLSIIIYLGIVLFASCEKSAVNDCFMSTGEIITETRSLEEFTCINLYDKFNFYIVEDTLSQIKIEAGENLIAGITTEIINDSLYIRNTNNCNWVRSYEIPINLYLSSESFRRLFVRGFSHVETVNTFKANYIYFVAESPISTAKLDVDVRTCYASISYSTGDFYLTGKTDSLRIFNFGTSFVYAQNLESERCWVWNESTGDCHVTTNKRLHVEIHRSGDVFYYKEPDQINIIDLSSTGRLIKK